MYAKLIPMVISMLPDAVKTFLIKVLILISCFVAGYFYGYQSKGNDVLQEQLEVVAGQTKEELEVKKDTVQTSDNVYEKIKNDKDLSNKLNKENDSTGTLNLRLPDATLRLLNNASGQERFADTAGRSDGKGSRAQTIHR